MNEQKQSSSSTGLIILVVVLIVLFLGALGGGGYFYYKYFQIKKDNETLSNQLQEAEEEKTTTTTTTDTTTTTTKTNDYVIAGSDKREVTKAELINLTPWQLKVARNEIYARHGRPFVHKDLQCYFATKSWYEEDKNFSNDELSTLENKNIATILAYEKEISSPLLEKDSGCNTNN